MLPEYEVELLTAALAEWRRQIAADASASAVATAAGSRPSPLERLFRLFHVDAAHVPASERSALQMECRLSR